MLHASFDRTGRAFLLLFSAALRKLRAVNWPVC